MLVRFTRRVAGDGYEAERGDVRDLPEPEAQRLIARNHAEAVAAPAPAASAAPPPKDAPHTDVRTTPPTAATVAAPERAVEPRARGRG